MNALSHYLKKSWLTNIGFSMLQKRHLSATKLSLIKISLDKSKEKELNTSLSEYFPPKTPDKMFRFLLSGIIDQMKTEGMKMDPKFVSAHECDMLLNDDKVGGKLKEMLRAAVSTSNFGKLRRLEVLQTLNHSPKDAHVEMVISTRLAKSYAVPYKGRVAQRFVKFVKERTRQPPEVNDTELYANTIPIVQSSGTGKSRMMTEVGKTIFTLPFCARTDAGTGWPPGDQTVVEKLMMPHLNSQTSIETHISLIAFLTAAFDQMTSVLHSFPVEKPDIGGLRDVWHAAMEPTSGNVALPKRVAFYQEVAERMLKIEGEILAHSKGLEPLPKYPATTEERRVFFAALANRVDMFSKIFLHPKVEALLHCIGQEPLVMYLDEAHNLSDRYWALQRVLWTLKRYTKVWFVFMGTNTALDNFVPAVRDLTSIRLADEVMVLSRPYSDIGFDQNIIDLPLLAPIRMMRLRSVEWICLFGRPLWNAQFSADKDTKEFFHHAQVKLLNSTTFHHNNSSSVEQIFAILSHIICLDLVRSNRAAVTLADKSVASHLRLLINLSSDRTIYITEAPSEPVLAVVAATMMADPDNNRVILEKFATALCVNGLVDKGLHGELLARMVFILARISSCPRPITHQSFLHPVPLVDFFKTLFGEELWNAAPGHEVFEQDLRGGYLNFTHWATTSAGLPNTPNPNLLAGLWARGSAVQCCFRQADVDGLCASYWGSVEDDAFFVTKKLGEVSIQAKMIKAGDTLSADKIQRRIGAQQQPFVVVFLDMGNSSNYTSSKCRLFLETGKETLKRLRGRASAQLPAETRRIVTKAIAALEANSNRYCISVRGCNEEVFHVLKTMGISREWNNLVNSIHNTDPLCDDVPATLRPHHDLDTTTLYGQWIKDLEGLEQPAYDETSIPGTKPV